MYVSFAVSNTVGLEHFYRETVTTVTATSYLNIQKSKECYFIGSLLQMHSARSGSLSLHHDSAKNTPRLRFSGEMC